MYVHSCSVHSETLPICKVCTKKGQLEIVRVFRCQKLMGLINGITSLNLTRERVKCNCGLEVFMRKLIPLAFTCLVFDCAH